MATKFGGHGASVLKLSRETMTYDWSFKIPPRSTICNNFAVLESSYSHDFENLKFSTGFLADVQHSLDFHIFRSLEVSICLTIYYLNYRDVGFVVHQSEVQALQAGKLKGYISFTPTATLTDLKQSGYKYWTTGMLELPESIWDDSVDTLQLVLNIQCASRGECVELNTVFADAAVQSEVSKDLSIDEYLLSASLSDVILVAKGEEFPAHRLILSCRSPVFKCMFQNQLKKPHEGSVFMDDVEPDVLKEMLHYIYTGDFSSSSIADGMCVRLLKSAETYGIEALKAECAIKITEKLKMENAVEVYIFGDKYNELLLTERSLELIKTDITTVFKDPETLRDLTNRCPNLLFELMDLNLPS